MMNFHYTCAFKIKLHKLMKTRLLSLLVILVALLSCEESVQVDGPKIPATDKTVTVILSKIPSTVVGAKVYFFTLNNKGEVFAMQEETAVEGAEIKVIPAPGLASFDIAALIPTEQWTSKSPFTEGHYSRAIAIQGKDGVFVTNSWTVASSLEGAPTTGIKSTVETVLFLNGSATPATTDFTKGDIISLDATTTDNIKSGIASVSYLLDGAELKSYTAKPYKFQFNTVAVAKGSHWLFVKAVNGAGHQSMDSINIFVSDIAGKVGPSVTLTNPSNGAQIERQTVVTLSANATDPDDGIDRVEFRVNNVLIGTDKTAPFTAIWDTFSNQVGSVTVEVTAFDKSSQSRSDVVNVTLIAPANYAPRATFTSPTSGATFAVGTSTVELAVTATDTEGDPINRVEFSYRNVLSVSDTFLGQDATSPYSFTFNTAALVAGEYVIFAKAVDNNGNSSYTSTRITIQ
jgi:hypothetical protein